MKLEAAIKQQAFKSEWLKADINLYYTAAHLNNRKNLVLKPFNLSIQQFNILRILRGQKGNPISMKEISNRMIDKMSNASRLVEKLRAKELVERKSCPNDRRAVEVVITGRGLETLEAASLALERGVMEYMKQLGDHEAKKLNDLLDQINSTF